MKSIHRAARCAVVLSVIGLSAACSMSPKAAAPSSSGEAAPPPGIPGAALRADEEGAGEPTTLADAEAQLEKARLELARLALSEPVPARAPGGSAPPSVTMTPAPSPLAPRDEARRAEKSASADAAPAAPAKEASTCETACKAFSSLARASDAVCRLDTDGGKRCERARQIREDASQRVAGCGCAR